MTGIDVPSTLNAFIAVCRDTEKFYDQAKDKVDDPGIQQIFSDMAMLRADTIAYLAPFVTVRGEPATKSGTVAGATHRILTNLHRAVSSVETRTLIAHSLAEEERALEELSGLVKDPLPPRLREIVRERVELFRTSRDVARGLLHSMA